MKNRPHTAHAQPPATFHERNCRVQGTIPARARPIHTRAVTANPAEPRPERESTMNDSADRRHSIELISLARNLSIVAFRLRRDKRPSLSEPLRARISFPARPCPSPDGCSSHGPTRSTTYDDRRGCYSHAAGPPLSSRGRKGRSARTHLSAVTRFSSFPGTNTTLRTARASIHRHTCGLCMAASCTCASDASTGSTMRSRSRPST